LTKPFARQTGERALATERHHDAIREARVGREVAPIAIVVGLGELPGAVQVEPLGPPRVGARVLRARDLDVAIGRSEQQREDEAW
jgi:hypothetical protein